MAWLDWLGPSVLNAEHKWSRSMYTSFFFRRHNFQYFTFKHDGFADNLHQSSFWCFGHGFISSLPYPECRPSFPNKLLKGFRLLGWSFVSHITKIGNWFVLTISCCFLFASKETSFSRQLVDIDFLPNIVNSISNFWRYIICHITGIWYISIWLTF